jgi:hypothetical protein
LANCITSPPPMILCSHTDDRNVWRDGKWGRSSPNDTGGFGILWCWGKWWPMDSSTLVSYQSGWLPPFMRRCAF